MVEFKLQTTILEISDETTISEISIIINKNMSNNTEMNGMYSIMVDEIECVKNDASLNKLKEGSKKGFYFFKDECVDSLSTLSIHIHLF